MPEVETLEEILEGITDSKSLRLAIEKLERRKELQEKALNIEFRSLLNSMKPANILKSTLSEIQESTPLKHNLLKVALGLGVGYFSRKMLVTKSSGIAKRALGAALQYGITHFIARKDENGETKQFSLKGLLNKGWVKKILPF